MSSSAKTAFSAGGAGSSKNYKVNVNLNSAGGSRKQGLTSTVGKDHWAATAIQTHAVGTQAGRSTIFSMNQLGGIGRGMSQFTIPNISSARGVHRVPPYVFKMNV